MEYVLKCPPGNKGRLKIGFLDDNLNDDFHSQILIGIFNAARDYDVDIIRFGYYSSHIAYKFSHQVDMVLDHIEQYDLDGLLFLGWTRAGAMYNYDNFTSRFGSIPTISIGTEYSGIPSVIFQGNEYVKELLLHLINVHKFKKIAFIEHYRPDNRSGYYFEKMKEYSYYDPGLYVGYDELKDCSIKDRGKRAVSILLDERGIVPDAIMTLNNVDAANIIAELKGRGIKVPSDIALTSYEDSEAAQFYTPGFTTIYFPWMELGYTACASMAGLLKKGTIPMSTIVEGRIIYRATCGCQPYTVMDADAGKVAPAKLKDTTGDFQAEEAAAKKSIADRMKREFPGLNLDFAPILEAFIQDGKTGTGALFLSELSRQLNGIRGAEHAPAVANLISVFRKLVLPYHMEHETALLNSGDLFQQAQALVSEKVAALNGYERVIAKIIDHTLQEISQSLVSNFSLQNLLEALEKNLPKLNIPGCYIFISNAMFTEDEFEKNLFDNCILVFEYSSNIRRESRTNKPSTARKILKEILTSRGRPFKSLAYMLHVTDEIFGFALFEPGPLDERIYHMLTTHISTALRGAIILNKLDASYKKLVEQAQREGMADIAADILHNIGNILNSVSVSVHLMEEAARSSVFEDLSRANSLLMENMHCLERFICSDSKGRKLMQFYLRLGESVRKLQSQLLYNSDRLGAKVGSISEIINAQQNYAGVNTMPERLHLEAVLEDALKVNSASLERYRVEVIRNYKASPHIVVQRARLFYILVNLINNAREAMEATPPDKRLLKMSLDQDASGITVRISDSGCGIPEGMLDKIFDYGCTTKTGRHGFGLHSCATYMSEMGGTLTAESQGPGKGATFILKF